MRFVSAAALLLTIGAGASAQPAPPPLNPAPSTSAAPANAQATQAEVEKRIASLRTQLAITPAETPAWDAFAQSMRNSSTATEALFEKRAKEAATMSAVDNMRSYADIAKAYADSMQQLSTAFGTLYASLTDAQRHTADALFRAQAKPK